MEYLDLTVRITPADGNTFRAAFTSPVGGGEYVFTPPAVPIPSLEAWLKTGSAGSSASSLARDFGPRSKPSASGLDPRKAGVLLYQSLFGQKLQSAFDRAVGNSQTDVGKGVRIRISMDLASEGMVQLARLPWELLSPGEAEPPLGTSIRTPLVRSIEAPQPVEPAPLRLPLRILAIPSNPKGTAPLDLEQERKRIEENWAPLPSVHVDFVRPIASEILTRLADFEYHVVHYMGHGTVDPNTGKGALLLETEDRSPDVVEGERLRVMFSDETTLRLVYLNACNTAAVSGVGENPFIGVATSLIRAGVPAVLAMQTPVRDDSAIRFASTFYRRIARGQPVDTAVSEARKELWDEHTSDWAVPVLFLRSQDGALFQLTGPQPAHGGAKRVFFTATNDTLRPLRRRLIKDLTARGMGIVEEVPPPFDAASHEEAVRAAVRAADLTVHLLDEEPGEVVEDGTDGHTYAGEQLRIGLESAQSQLVLVPEQADFTRIEKPAYKQLIDSLSTRPRDADRLQVVHEAPSLMLDEIVGMLRKQDEARLQREAPRTSVDAVFVDLHGKDMASANDLIAYLMRRNIAPVLMPALDESPASALPLFEETLKKVQLCMVVYGGVNREWVLHRLIAAMQVVTLNALATRVCVYVAPPTKTSDVLRFPPAYQVALGMDGFEPSRLENLLGAPAGSPS